jgi:hypothetical protein
MPAQFTIKAADLRVLLAELRQIDPNLRKELQKEMRSGLKPIVSKLQAGIPKQTPLSGFSKSVASETYSWSRVSGRTLTPLGKRAKKRGFYPVVSMAFRSQKDSAGFEIMELAGTRNIGKKKNGLTSQGRAMIRALNAVAPVQDGLGRFVIPQAKGEANAVMTIARRIIEKYVAIVNRRIS